MGRREERRLFSFKISTAQHARWNVILPGEVAEFIELVLNFADLCFQYGDARFGCDADIALVHVDAGLRYSFRRLCDVCLGFAKGGFAPVELSLKNGCLLGVPGGILRPRLERCWLRLRSRCLRRCFRGLTESRDQAPRAKLIHIVVRPNFFGLVGLSRAWLLCRARWRRNRQPKDCREWEEINTHGSSGGDNYSVHLGAVRQKLTRYVSPLSGFSAHLQPVYPPLPRWATFVTSLRDSRQD